MPPSSSGPAEEKGFHRFPARFGSAKLNCESARESSKTQRTTHARRVLHSANWDVSPALRRQQVWGVDIQSGRARKINPADPATIENPPNIIVCLFRKLPSDLHLFLLVQGQPRCACSMSSPPTDRLSIVETSSFLSLLPMFTQRHGAEPVGRCAAVDEQ